MHNRVRQHTMLAMATALLIGSAAHAQTASWTGGGDSSDWFDPLNWSPAGEPATGVIVVVNGGSIVLTNSTRPLAALALTNATLTVKGWNSVLQAGTVTILDGGKITHDGPHNSFINEIWTAWAPSNRIHIVCSNLHVTAGGEINADFSGYSGGRKEGTGTATQWGHGPGGSRGVNSEDNAKAGGAGYGGRGGNGRPEIGGPAYGDAVHPETPGSGGGGGHSAAGAHGGGVIRVEAAGTITVDGLIHANGAHAAPNGPRHAGGGAGGSVYLSCRTFDGCGGIVEANGGNKAVDHSGGGAGGRIAVHYDTAEQALRPRPHVLFSAKPGDNFRHNRMVWYRNWTQRECGNGFPEEPEWGSLYFSDPDGIIGFGDGAVVTNLNGFLCFGEGLPPEDGTNRLSLANLTITGNTAIGFDTNAIVEIAGKLSIDPGSGLIARHPLTLAVGGDLLVEGDIRTDAETRLRINGNLVIDGGRLRSRQVDFDVGGDLSLTNQAWLVVQNLHAGDGLVQVGNCIDIATNCWIYPISHHNAGGVTRFMCRTMRVAAGGGFDANGGGYSQVGAGPGAGINDTTTSLPYGGGGGGHGGHGGWGGQRAGGAAYPASYQARTQTRPQPGSPGGRSYQVEACAGGGAIWIETDGELHLDGTLCANGLEPRATASSRRPGSGSGGAILVVAERLTGGPYAVIEARGGDGEFRSITEYGGSGGGGRIAIWHGLTRVDRDPLLADLSNPSVQHRIETVASLPGYSGTPITADKGAEADDALDPTRHSESGTVDFIRMHAPFGTLFLLR